MYEDRRKERPITKLRVKWQVLHFQLFPTVIKLHCPPRREKRNVRQQASFQTSYHPREGSRPTQYKGSLPRPSCQEGAKFIPRSRRQQS